LPLLKFQPSYVVMLTRVKLGSNLGKEQILKNPETGQWVNFKRHSFVNCTTLRLTLSAYLV